MEIAFANEMTPGTSERMLNGNIKAAHLFFSSSKQELAPAV